MNRRTLFGRRRVWTWTFWRVWSLMWRGARSFGRSSTLWLPGWLRCSFFSAFSLGIQCILSQRSSSFKYIIRRKKINILPHFLYLLRIHLQKIPKWIAPLPLFPLFSFRPSFFHSCRGFIPLLLLPHPSASHSTIFSVFPLLPFLSSTFPSSSSVSLFTCFPCTN